MYKFLFIVAALLPLSMGQLVGEACANGAPLPAAVYVAGCATSPCTIVNGQTLTMEMTFIAG
jgi:Ni,Fe-hydrogenase III small subunit